MLMDLFDQKEFKNAEIIKIDHLSTSIIYIDIRTIKSMSAWNNFAIHLNNQTYLGVISADKPNLSAAYIEIRGYILTKQIPWPRKLSPEILWRLIVQQNCTQSSLHYSLV